MGFFESIFMWLVGVIGMFINCFLVMLMLVGAMVLWAGVRVQWDKFTHKN